MVKLTRPSSSTYDTTSALYPTATILTQSKQHLTSYPVVSDGISQFKSNPYGAKSIALTQDTYNRFGAPFTPYLRTPYAYASPYLSRADSLADSGLGSIDAHFPLVKQDTQTVVDTGKSYALYPIHLADSGFNYVLRTWDDEYTKTIKRNNRGPGLLSSVLAVVSTELKISSDVLAAVADWFQPKKDAAKKKKDGFVERAGEKKDAYAERAGEKKDSYVDAARKSVDGVAKKTHEKTT